MKMASSEKKEIYSYLVIMLCGVSFGSYISKFTGNGSLTVWSINLVGWFIVYGKYFIKIKRNIAIFSITYIGFGLVSFIININYLTTSLKGLGTNIGIIMVPLFFALFMRQEQAGLLDEKDIIDILRFISLLGMIALTFSLAIGYKELINALMGLVSVYNVSVEGIFNSKNSYGAFLGLSCCADLLLLKLQKSARSKRLFICIIKFFGIVFSFSRTALLQVVIVAFLFFWLEKKRTIKEWILLVLSAVAALWLFYNNDTVHNLLINQILRLDVGDAGRANARVRVLQNLPNNLGSIIFGIGYAGIDYYNADIDNSYYYIFLSGGMVKSCFYLYFVYYSLKKIVLLKRRNHFIGNMCMSVAVSYYVFAFFESVPILELGILNYLFMIFMYIIPCMFK